MVAFIFLIVILPIALLITAIIIFAVSVVDAIYDVGVALHKGKEPVNKYRKG